MTTRRPILFLATAVVALAAGLALGAGTVLAQDPPAASSAAAAAPAVISVAPTLPTDPQPGGTGRATVSTAIAYPYMGVTTGVAPDHTIVVTGTGDSTLAADASDRAAAERAAIAAALADAKVQADVIAHGTGLTITGVLSVSASVSPYGPVPLGMGAPVPGSNTMGSAPGMPTILSPESLTVSVTVAYQVR